MGSSIGQRTCPCAQKPRAKSTTTEPRAQEQQPCPSSSPASPPQGSPSQPGRRPSPAAPSRRQEAAPGTAQTGQSGSDLSPMAPCHLTSPASSLVTTDGTPPACPPTQRPSPSTERRSSSTPGGECSALSGASDPSSPATEWPLTHGSSRE